MKAISISDSTVKQVNMRAVNYRSNGQQLAGSASTMLYDPVVKRFFITNNDALQSDNTFVMAAELTSQGEELVMKKLTTFFVSNAYAPHGLTVTSLGAIGSSTSNKKNDFVILNSAYTPLELAGVPDVFDFSVAGLPAFTPASSNKPAITDFVRYPAGTPTEIVNFMKSRVTADCAPNNYGRVELYKRVGTEQLALSEASCNVDGAVYYIKKNGTFTQVYATQEGIDCTERDKLGISPELTGCRKPGEGL
ncbi:hypothetical protein KDA23_07480 [Candidatus Saccharibacteria bacterium]|nr:hypothetical protein [Candidatus Saccharibacteria bacterium]